MTTSLTASTTTATNATLPDSTTEKEELERIFTTGQDVLLKQKDGRYYLGTVVEIDQIREQCLLKFGDNTSSWSSFKDLTKLSTPEQEDLLCVVCKKSAPKNKQEIIVCDKCSRGYHQKCHQPEIPLDDGLPWKCKRCTQNLKKRKERAVKLSRRESLRSTYNTAQVATSSCSKIFSYDLEALTWDTYHRVNKEQIYCYCGGTGEWYRQMLQCSRCRQWFHENCLDCVQYPLYCGDRFYVFVCAVCNHGNEFLRRLEVSWVDLVHLMLFNLTVYHSKKYYDMDSVIIPYINDNWHTLQLSPKITNVTKSERRDNILSILTNNRNRFKCGREIKKRTSIWGLRVRLPPPAPFMNLPANGFVTEDQLRILWQGHRKLQFLPEATNVKTIANDSRMRTIMQGTAYQQTSALSDSESPSPTPEQDDPRTIFKPEYIGAGCVKKSVPFPKLSLQRRKRLLSLNQTRRRALRKNKRRSLDGEPDEKRAYVTRLSDKSHGGNDSLPLTPPTSVSAPPTPPLPTPISSDLSNDYAESLHKHCDTSGDETSSKSTLDLIIPPPKDFEGKNNPFLALLKGKEDAAGAQLSENKITLPLPLTAVIPGKPVMRPKKRQLSEKDIFIGPNGEVKRRRMRRHRLSSSPSVSTTTPGAGRNGENSQENGADYAAYNGRRLRQRPLDKEKEKLAAKQSPVSPVKKEPEIDIDNLKSSVNSYFGAANRIAAGERFAVKAKRVGPAGRIECLIEWEGAGGGNPMT